MRFQKIGMRLRNVRSKKRACGCEQGLKSYMRSPKNWNEAKNSTIKKTVRAVVIQALANDISSSKINIEWLEKIKVVRGTGSLSP